MPASTIPTADLDLARRGTNFFLAQLATLTDADLDEPSLLPAWSRRHLVAHVGFSAKAVTRVVEWAKTGIEQAIYPSPEAREAEIQDGATWTAHHLREHVATTADRLVERWAELTEQDWTTSVQLPGGTQLPVAQTPWMRCREVWIHSVDLGVVGFTDVPGEVVDRLLAELVEDWPSDAPALGPTGVDGPPAALVAWALGRGSDGVTTADGSPVPTAPAWA